MPIFLSALAGLVSGPKLEVSTLAVSEASGVVLPAVSLSTALTDRLSPSAGVA